MYHHTSALKNHILEKHLSVLAKCYSSGCFDDLFPLLSDDCVFETQWRLNPDVGKSAVIAYFTGKGQTMRDYHACPVCDLISFVGDSNPIRNADITLNDEQQFHGTFLMMYEPDKLALRMRQTLNGQTNLVIADLTLNETDQISRIDLCMPELFRYRVLKEAVG